ncbi:flavin prenyltransferase [Azospirillaceae bacterium]
MDEPRVVRYIKRMRAQSPSFQPSPCLPPRLIVGVSGASGVRYGVRLLETLRLLEVESHLIMTRAAELTLAQETDLTIADVRQIASAWHEPENIGASIASGGFRTLGMVVAPCSIRSMSEIASGIAGSLLTRAADVTLKERRRLVLMVRETPFHLGHLRSMTALTEMGAIIAPPIPAFYNRPQTIEELIDQSVGRVLDLFGLTAPGVRRWGENIAPL